MPPDLILAADRVLERYSRPVAHLNERFWSGRLGLIFGAGIRSDLGFPGWEQLVRDIAKSFQQPIQLNDRIDPVRQSQLLFQHYCRYEAQTRDSDGRLTREDLLRLGWLELIHSRLYHESGPTEDAQPRKPTLNIKPEELESRSPYLRYFIPLIQARI